MYFIIIIYYLLLCYSDDQGLVYKDAIFISTHKFVGGVETPGKQTLHVIKSVTGGKRKDVVCCVR